MCVCVVGELEAPFSGGGVSHETAFGGVQVRTKAHEGGRTETYRVGFAISIAKARWLGFDLSPQDDDDGQFILACMQDMQANSTPSHPRSRTSTSGQVNR